MHAIVPLLRKMRRDIRSKFMTHKTIGGVTKTICDLFGIECENGSLEDSLEPVVENAIALGIDRCERVLLYAPDAIGFQLCVAFPHVIVPAAKEASIVVRLESVVPPVTPVCFATMFTGQPPSIHGIRKYEKPVLRCKTLFDRLIDAGKRVAIVAVNNSSIDLLFRDRALDYFSERYDSEVTERTLQLLEADGHDFILAYHQEYDDTLHLTTPQAEAAIEAMQRHVASFVQLARAVDRSWGSYHRMIGFVPDHGGHIDPNTGRGTHGINTPEDMDVQHFYGVFRRGDS
jgi:hypothetical protein